MRSTLLGLAGITALVVAAAGTSFAADVNCGIVNKSLAMGRTVDEVATTTMISPDDVKKCQAEAKKGGAANAPAGAGEAAGATGKPGAAADNPKSPVEKPVGSGGH